MQELETLFDSVYSLKKGKQSTLVTRNLTPGITYYGEPVFSIDKVEYRSWNPTRSKLGAVILKGLKEMPIKPGSLVLYLGVASGTTVSHVSDIVGEKGHIWGLDFAPRAVRDLIDNVIRHRKNISPILGDARQPESYSTLVQPVDVVFADVAQPDQAKIIVDNARHYLRKGGDIMLSIKARSIDVKENPKNIYEDQIKVLEEAGFIVKETIDLHPFEKDHAMVIASF
ncbi:fibrillarin-like rRNA/tRNA 2'-O-methyltransferase [Candidatus Bathyarchaeota archaeon]|nr:fibrillarin-like rRNA/tRNA 2'-O-methyltransferase [Candidatus Bathyarchaeota archaeon]